MWSSTLYSYDYEGIGLEEFDEDEDIEIHFSVEEKESNDCSEIKKQKKKEDRQPLYTLPQRKKKIKKDPRMNW